MKKTNIKITRYADGEFVIDIVKTKDMNGDDIYEAWLQHKNYGVSDMMFGYRCKDVTYDEFIEMVEANLPDHEINYMQDRLEEDVGFDESEDAPC